MDIRTHEIRNIAITPEILKLIAEIDEFKGRWKVMESLAPVWRLFPAPAYHTCYKTPHPVEIHNARKTQP